MVDQAKGKSKIRGLEGMGEAELKLVNKEFCFD